MKIKLIKKERATSLPHAFQLCKDYAEISSRNSVKQLNVPRIADGIGKTADLLYKYIADARMPASLILPYETTCGYAFVTQYLAHSHGCLLVQIPSGRKAEHKELNQLNQFMNNVMNLLLELDAGGARPEDVLSQLFLLMQDLAYQHHNTEKLVTRQQELF